ncbi:MAG: sodium:solute symporter, partial [Gemmatimonadetes bacterium]|nr:sodium:solute symporter [Gemmatimonadota bacterium]NIR80425.1 sodium:solute symporter [Gemmatimonadota bacterium]NIT89185.1 sodium:solute symporter [Gemmatimonadota bacterium]NIU32985.1 sodium:solute symporter [Gemmatimonadota bacterium]NIU37372.1 sodium:solute symporter [Gemmatimonadota bacterium]
GQFLLFLLVGVGLWAFYGGGVFERPDEIFARFIVDELPPGVTGLLIAGIFAAAMSSLSSSINSLASATAYDFWAPLRGVDDDARVLRAGKAFTLLWAGLLIAGAILFIPLSRGTAAVEVALGVASMVYGGLLGAFFLAVISRRADQRGAIMGITVGIASVVLIWLFARTAVAWPWFVLIGTTVTLVAGWAGSGRGAGSDPSAGVPGARAGAGSGAR